MDGDKMTREEIMRDLFEMACVRNPGIDPPVIDWVPSATGVLIWTPNAQPVRIPLSPAARDQLWINWNKAVS